MNCEQAANVISARTDGELAGDDPAAVALDAHLAECAACRATAEAVQLQDAALVRAFAPGRRAAEAVAERVVAALGDEDTPVARPVVVSMRPPRRRMWLAGLAASAVAAGVVLAAVTLGPRLWRTKTQQVVVAPPPVAPVAPVAPAAPVAQVALSMGEVFTCPQHAPGAWKPVAAGAAVAEGGVRTAPAGRVELRLADGSQVRLNGDTEAWFAAGRVVELRRGQLWSAVPQDSQPLRVTVPAEGPGVGPGGAVTAVTAPGGRADFACSDGGGVLTAVQGPVKVIDQRGVETQVPAGESATIRVGVSVAHNPDGDLLLATRWLNDLLVLKGRDDPELIARVNELLSRIRTEAAATRPAGAAPVPGPVEQHLRAEGPLWSTPIACYVQSHESRADRGKRLTAARLLSDLAPPSAIPDLIALMGDRDGEVRLQVAKALHRLTGQSVGQSPEQCAADSGAAVEQTQKKWQAWWEQNKGRYSGQAR